MKLGFEWDESLPYSDVRNSEISMESSIDRCRYVLERLTVNDALKTLTITLDLQANDLQAVPAIGEVQISKHELSALFRKQTHKNYREPLDQLMRGFLKGLQLKYHAAS